MAVKVKPAARKVNPIVVKTPVQGVKDSGDTALLKHASKGIPTKKVTASTGASLGTKVAGSTSIKGASV